MIAFDSGLLYSCWRLLLFLVLFVSSLLALPSALALLELHYDSLIIQYLLLEAAYRLMSPRARMMWIVKCLVKWMQMLELSRMLFSWSRHNRYYRTANQGTRGKVLRVIDHIILVSRWMISSLIPQVVMLLARLRPTECADRLLGGTGPSLVLRWLRILSLFQILVTLPALNHLWRRHRFEMLMRSEVVSACSTQFLGGFRPISCTW